MFDVFVDIQLDEAAKFPVRRSGRLDRCFDVAQHAMRRIFMDCLEYRSLVLEIAVNERLRDAQLAGQNIDAGCVIPTLVKKLGCFLHDARALV